MIGWIWNCRVCFRQNGSKPLHDFRTATHCTKSSGDPTSFGDGRRMWYFTSTIRAVFSARSRNFPAWMKFHPSSWDIVASVAPWKSWHCVLIASYKACGASSHRFLPISAATRRCRSLRHDHISVVICSRTARAFSRARWRHPAIEFG